MALSFQSFRAFTFKTVLAGPAAFVALGVVLALSGCNPRDPEVLSAAERACANDYKKCPKFQTQGNNNQGGRTNSNARPNFPEDLDGIATNYILEREEQALTYLRLADELLAGNVSAGDCFAVTELPGSIEARSFYLESRYPYCFQKFSSGDVKTRGRVKMVLGLNEGKLSSLTVTSEMEADGHSSLRYQVSKQGVKKNLQITDDFTLQLFRTENEGVGSFKLAEFVSNAAIDVIDFNEIKESHSVKFQAWGQYLIEEAGGGVALRPQLSSTLNHRGTVTGGGQSWYDAVLGQTRAQGPAIQKPRQELAECGAVSGTRELRFDYLKDKSRERNLVTYSGAELKIEDPKAKSPQLNFKRTPCVKPNGKAPMWFGVGGVAFGALIFGQ